MATPNYAIGKTVSAPFAHAVRSARRALEDEGFGVLTEIDVQATLLEKLGLQTPPYVILGACNPRSASQVLVAEPEMGLFLPCNLIVYVTDEGTRVSAVDPEAMLGFSENETIGEVAAEVKTRLVRVIEQI